EALAGIEMRLLRSFPRYETRGYASRRDRFIIDRAGGRGELIAVGADSSEFAGRCYVKADVDRIAVSVRDGGAVFVGRVGVVIARHDGVKTVPLLVAAEDAREDQYLL